MKLFTSGFWFGLVGLSAAVTHGAVFALTRHAMWPELANALGFCAGFFVSFTGHRNLSFRDTQTSMGQSLYRFLATALLGFATNELVYVLCYRALAASAWSALIVAMGVAAIQTFVLSRFWAFRR